LPCSTVAGSASLKVERQHLERLAVVYIRQSSPRQVLENRESTARQYALADYAALLGWPRDRVLVIDDDQGHSSQQPAEDRLGFQRVLAEVSMDHVGIVLGLEMSRLARCDKDFCHLMEVCGIFGTLLADQEGIYNAADPNDRLVLGLKGMLSSVELHTMRNRLDKGKLNKAARGELILDIPIGYVRVSSAELALDPDEQVRAIVALIFNKFDELGSACAVFRYLLAHNIRVGVRQHDGPNAGQVEWRRPSRSTLSGMLRNPTYAGTYAYGRSITDPKRKYSGRSRKGRRFVPMEQWKVKLHDRVPAYLTWERYLRNQERLRQNRVGWDSRGAPRQGAALLGGLLFCARCGTRLGVYYGTPHSARYDCLQHFRHGVERTCHGLAAATLDALVVQQVLRALEPAALELSLAAVEDVQRERERLALNLQQQLERAQFEAKKAERHYRAVDPENRLVTRTLERQWEEALHEQYRLQEEYERFLRQTPLQLTVQERQRVQQLASNLPALWDAPETTFAERKEIIRCLIERIVIGVQGNTEYVDVTIHWAGGFTSQHQLLRRIAGYSQLRDFNRLVERVRALKDAGHTAAQIAALLNEEGFRPAGQRTTYHKQMVRQLLSRWGLSGERNEKVELGADEWWLSDLARRVGVNISLMRHWLYRGWVHSRRTPLRGFCILWADCEELQRLGRLRAHAEAHPNTVYPKEITVPKERKAAKGKRKASTSR
jgi:DNA invertase Pin-like site-specific DNA recombinase